MKQKPVNSLLSQQRLSHSHLNRQLLLQNRNAINSDV